MFLLKFTRLKYFCSEISLVSHLRNIGGSVFEAGLSLTTVSVCFASLSNFNVIYSWRKINWKM